MQIILKILSGVFDFSKLYKKVIIPILILALLSVFTYYFHYLPMETRDKTISTQSEKIDLLELNVSNLSVLLVKKEDDQKKQSFEENQTIENVKILNEIKRIEELLYDEINSSIGSHIITI